MAITVILLAPSIATARVPIQQDDPERPIAQLQFQDLNGNAVDLRRSETAGPVVVVFLGTECPLAKLYGGRVQQIAEQYPNVPFYAIFANAQDSPGDIEEYVALQAIRIPVVHDQGNRIADALSAERTPEAFLLDGERQIRYRGRIDDQYGVGYARRQPTSNDLCDALDEVLADRPVTRPSVPAVGCLIGRVKSSAPEPSALVRDVAGILHRHCVQCHREGEIGPFPLTEPTEIAGWAEMIDEVVQEGRMPPWHAAAEVGTFANERRLTANEKQRIAEWVRAGAPLGDTDSWPAAPSFVEGWQLPREPDLILPVSPRPVTVPARGDVEYQYFQSEYESPRDTWVQGVQLLPGNHRLVHHILAFVADGRESESIGQLEGIDGYLAGYVPGLTPLPFAPGMAKRIPAGSRLLFQVHYTPIGTEQKDQSHIGLLFADDTDITHEVVTTSALRRQLEIPPRVEAHRVTSFSHRRLDNALLLGMMPHLHLRGKSFYYELQRDNGSVVPLLDVPAYDFNWQTSYRLAEPMALRDGDRICCVAQYDNSAGNVHNPNPDLTVRWGDQTHEEMMIGYFDIAVPRDVDLGSARLDLRRHVARVRLMDQFDRDHNGRIEQNEISNRLLSRFHSLDGNEDQQVTFGELASRWEE